ncbi:NAD(P)/FAD-dependent oxidoreductase [Knoellia sp. Soil729]|uniref:NAD(P)/FAD-dependent oxidoreductase n=1 Tax=Knoellia sp. Soil729 TaxID=1736394 RepID=UPI0006F9026F|nr:NAD(P)/FAD-dependent oxidoreductase [Knoellia sp. Soil729]KRE41099.1 thioredoxin reductase [Knoellia sp. Soil729]
MNSYDTIIIGGGAAGLSAALVLSRARRRVLVIDAGEPRNAPAAHMHGFLSRDGMPPALLLETGRREVEGYGGEIRRGVALEVVRCGADGFQVLLEGGERLGARRLLVTTGLRDELPEIPGLRERWGRDVLHCPYCHGWEVRDQRLGIIWNGPQTVGYAQVVRQWSGEVTMFAPKETLTNAERTQLLARGITVVEEAVDHVVVQDDRLTGIAVDGGTVVACEAVFVPPRFVPHVDLLLRLGCEVDDSGWVITGEHGATSIPGVRVAGNVANARAQVITAAGEGSAAAIALNAELVDEDVRNAVRDARHGVRA